MISTDLLFWWHMGIVNRRRYEYLLQEYGTLRSARSVFNRALLDKLHVKESSKEQVLERAHHFNAAALQKEMEEQRVELLFIEDEAYPRLLREIADPPMFLSYCGNSSLLKKPSLGIVGTRTMSMYGKRVAEQFSGACAQSGLVTVSGLALGVDSVVAKETIDSGGATIAVLGGGLGCIYPKGNQQLAKTIVEEGGLLVSEFPLHQRPEQYMFPARNRIIAGLSLGTLVVEAPLGSGSIITAELALEYGREVFAVPGQVFDVQYEGCHMLIRSGQAKLVHTPQDVFEDIGIVSVPGSGMQFEPTTNEEQVIFAELSSMPLFMDDLVEKTQLSSATVLSTLTLMELAGAVQHIGNGQWVRSTSMAKAMV